MVWPRNFKIEKLKNYDEKKNPENWLALYEIAIRSAMGDEHVMANYFLIILDHTVYQWLISQEPHRFNSWGELRRAFIDNFIATCDQPGNKYDLQRICEDRGQPQCEYIRRFSDMRCTIPKVTDDEAILAFIQGLHHHNALRTKLL